eukprot:jgi/Bigna1/75550/fgenesh1_pg.35_\
MCSSCTYIERELPQFAEYYGPGSQRICRACDQKQTDLEEQHVKKMQRRKRSRSPRGEIQLRKAIREKARELAKEQDPTPTLDAPQSSRLMEILIFFTAVLVIFMLL